MDKQQQWTRNWFANLVKNTDTYCHCSRGGLREIFAAVVKKPVKAEMEEPIMKRGQQCRFSISF